MSPRKFPQKKVKKVITKKPTTTGTDAKAKRDVKAPTLLRGMKDILPKEERYWRAMHHKAEDIATAYGFQFIETPILEEVNLFIRSIGKGTDVVDKEMYVFEDKDGSKVALRPEFTASIARSYINHGLHSLTQPVKVWSIGPMFRHDRPQAGRFRQFHQFGCESIGEKDPSIDAELIATAYFFLKDLGVSSHVYMNSIGSLEERENYIIELVGYLRTKRSYLCEDCKKRVNKNPLRVLDCKEVGCKEVVDEAPQIIEWLGEKSKKYFMTVLEYLDEVAVPYILKHTLVRGLDYYTDTVFEIYEDTEEEKSQSALGGGGRYDNLIEQLGGRESTPACGFAIGLERVATALRRQAESGVSVIGDTTPTIYLAQLGDQARKRALKLVEELRVKGVIVLHNLAKSSLKSQLEIADKFKVTHTLILGQKEVQDDTIIIRDMESGNQEIVGLKRAANEVNRILGKR
jgi:histidyl-tRNA synthetase